MRLVVIKIYWWFSSQMNKGHSVYFAFFGRKYSLETQIPLKVHSEQKVKLNASSIDKNDCIWTALVKEWGQHNGICSAQGHCALVWSQLADPQELLHRHYQHIACSVRIYLASVISVIGALTKPQRQRILSSPHAWGEDERVFFL